MRYEQTKVHHLEGPPKLGKLGATPHAHLEIASIVESTGNDVEWESEPENDTADQQVQLTAETGKEKSVADSSPFNRNSNLRKPCRHKSLEQLQNGSTSKGDRSNWPALARAGMWNSMEQMRKRHEFEGERSKSLPTSRWHSADRIDCNGAGLWQLSEKLNSLRSSRSSLDKSNEDIINGGEKPFKPPAHLTTVQHFRTEIKSDNPSTLSKPIPLASRWTESNHGDSSLRSSDGFKGARSAESTAAKNCIETPLKSILNLAKVFPHFFIIKDKGDKPYQL